MRIGVLGTGGVGRTIATKLVELGHEVTIGSREARENPDAPAPIRTFAETAAHAELVFNCTAGTASLEALRAAGAEELRGKVLVDVANPLDFSQGMPPTLSVCNDDSLAEQIQREFPDTRVVKALNTMTARLMVDPTLVPGDHDVPICGDDESAKRQVAALLQDFGWPADRIVDLGGIEAARGTEMYLPLWLRAMGAFGTPEFNIRFVRAT